MTALARSTSFGLLSGMRGPAAGPTATQLVKITVSALEELKSGVTAGSSYVFHDLSSLAAEHGIDPHDSSTLKLAQLFLFSLPSHFRAPELALDSDGEVLFDWRGSAGEMLTIALRGDGRLSYAARMSSWDKDHGTKRFVDSIPAAVLSHIRKVSES